jgi:hypothetical protein
MSQLANAFAQMSNNAHVDSYGAIQVVNALSIPEPLVFQAFINGIISHVIVFVKFNRLVHVALFH